MTAATSSSASAASPSPSSPSPSLEDRVALRELAEAYARAADRIDAAGLAALFTPEGVLRVGAPGASTAPPAERIGREQIEKAIGGLSRYLKTMHFVGNQYLTVDASGDRATGETYCIAHHISGESGSQNDHVMIIRYQDQFVRTADGWQIAVRELVVDWTETRTVTSP
jgi:ketosteroid isomerase-like protein